MDNSWFKKDGTPLVVDYRNWCGQPTIEYNFEKMLLLLSNIEGLSENSERRKYVEQRSKEWNII